MDTGPLTPGGCHRHPKLPQLTWCLLLCLAVLTGCTSTVEYRTNDWSTYEGPGAHLFRMQEVSLPVAADPLEPTNRRTWGFNDGVAAVIRPLAAGYRFIVPGFARTGISNFFDNLLYPVRLVNNLVQGKGAGAWDETKRFAVNTTVGVLGFWDAAGDSIPRSDEDTGMSIAAAGWEDSSFVVLPIIGPSTSRDALGEVGDILLDPATYFFPASIVRRGNQSSDQVEEFTRLDESTYDLYNLAKLLSELNRGVAVSDYEHMEDTCQHCLAKETIQAIFLTYRDPDFPSLAVQRRADIPGTDRSVEYSLFLQPEPAPMVYILPGLGGHRMGNSAYGLAEMVYRHGLSAVTLSSAMNFEFIESASSVALPGFAPVDARDVHAAVDAIHRDIAARHAGRVTSQVLMGLSMGAFHTLFIASAADDPGSTLMTFDRYVAINPPVRLELGMRQLDAYYNAPLELPVDDRQGAIMHTLRKALDVGGGTLQPDSMLPFNELESQFLIGLSFRQTLQDVIFQTQLRENMGVLRTELRENDRGPAYREISGFSYLEYFYAFVLPYYAGLRDDISNDDAGAQRIFELCDLRSIQGGLVGNPRVHLVTNEDDFLLDRSDLDWLRDTFGHDRCHHFEHGGHLGNLYTQEVQDEVMEAILAEVPDQVAQVRTLSGAAAAH